MHIFVGPVTFIEIYSKKLASRFLLLSIHSTCNHYFVAAQVGYYESAISFVVIVCLLHLNGFMYCEFWFAILVCNY